MLVSGTAGAICGLLLGRWCTVFALVPAHAVSIVVVAILAAALSLGAGEAIGAFVAWSIGCETGYVLAAVLLLAPHRRRRSAPPLRRAP